MGRAENKSGSRSQGSGVREAGRFAYGSLERLFHERARLSIVSSLAAYRDGVVFSDLKVLCALTDGNLSRQLQTLQEAQIIEVWKGTKNNRPQTLCRLSDQGRRRFAAYVSGLQQVIEDAQSDASTEKASQSHPRGLSLT